MLHKKLRPIHPFPARMAPEVVWDELPARSRRLRVLDPMAGSGTTLVTAKLRGHEAVGYDRDPLAVLLSRTWVTTVRADAFRAKAKDVLLRARACAVRLKSKDAYPHSADDETKKFVRYWFDVHNRVQLTALAQSISRLRDTSLRTLMWCAFSRLIITKSVGVSLAMDVSHSRPHRTYDTAPVKAFDRFSSSVEYIIGSAPFPKLNARSPAARVRLADARNLPLPDESVDVVITSPPYLNAIDYIRGHKLSLVWMKHSIGSLRQVRATNVGTETMAHANRADTQTESVIDRMCIKSRLSRRNTGLLRQYVHDMRQVMTEVRRVLRRNAKAVFVIGDCNIRGVFVRNSKCLIALAKELGLTVTKTRRRPLPDSRRYLPPPASTRDGHTLSKRMREEVIITMRK
jgi:DNA modification methylase